MEPFGLKRYVMHVLFWFFFHGSLLLYPVKPEVKPVQPEVKPVQDLLAQRKALRKHSNSLRLAIETDVTNIAFKLCAAGLIPSETRKNEDAAEIVSSIENQLQYDGSVWDMFLNMLKNCSQTEVLAHQLEEEVASGTNSQARQ